VIPELRYDGAGNAYARDDLGNWRAHPGIAQGCHSSAART